MAKHRDYSKEYRKARELFMRRRREWIKTKHWYVEAPEIPKSPTLKDIQRLEETRIENLTKRQVTQYEKQYDIAYEEGKIDLSRAVSNRFISPQTEDEYLKAESMGIKVSQSSLYGKATYETQPVESDAEILADLQALLEGLIEHGLPLVPFWQSTDAKLEKIATVTNIFNSAVIRCGNLRNYLHYLEEPSTHSALTSACDGIFKASTYEQLDESIHDFATILNLDRPLTNEQSYTLTTEDSIDFDYSDTIME